MGDSRIKCGKKRCVCVCGGGDERRGWQKKGGGEEKRETKSEGMQG